MKAELATIPLRLVEPHPRHAIRFEYRVKPLAELLRATADENTLNGQLVPGRVVPRDDGKEGYWVYIGVKRYYALTLLYGETRDERFGVFVAYMDTGLSDLEMFVRAKSENEEENGEREGFSILEEVSGIGMIRSSIRADELKGDLKRLYDLSGRLSEEKLKKLYEAEQRTRFKFRLVQLERLCRIEDDREFSLAAASTSGFGFSGDDIEKAVEGRNAAYSLDWFGDVFPEYSSEGAPKPEETQQEAGDEEAGAGGDDGGQHLEAHEKEVILAACPKCRALNMVHVQGEIEATHIPPAPEGERTTVVAESFSRVDPKCWDCQDEFYIFVRRVEGRRYATDASPSKKFREPRTIVEAIDVRYDYEKKVWQKIADGKIAGVVRLSSGRKGGSRKG